MTIAVISLTGDGYFVSAAPSTISKSIGSATPYLYSVLITPTVLTALATRSLAGVFAVAITIVISEAKTIRVSILGQV